MSRHRLVTSSPVRARNHRALLVCLSALMALASLLAAQGATLTATAASSQAPNATFPAPIKHVFVIVEENRDWADIKGNATFPYTNSLLKTGTHAENYRNVPEGEKLHPSEPNYIVMEAGSELGFDSDHKPSAKNSSDTTDHLVTYLQNAGLNWKSYQEDISGTYCPLEDEGDYAPKHNPMLFFQDVTDNNDPNSANCIKHVRPYSELAGDLDQNTVADYNFITPNLCNDMHDKGCDEQADTWLSREIPKIMASEAYKDNGAIFLTWDEGGKGNEPIGMIVLSPLAKAGYSNTIAYSHTSLLRTLQEIFGVAPLLRGAADATDLSDLFVTGGTAAPSGQSVPPSHTDAVAMNGDRRPSRV